MAERNERQPIIIYPSRVKLILLISTALLLLGACVIALPDPRALVGFLLFGYGLYYGLKRLFVRQPSLVINQRGIEDRATVFASGFTPWEEVGDAFVYTYKKQVFIGIFPKDINAFLRRQGVWKRIMYALNRQLGVQSPINIPQTMLPMKAERVLAQIESYRNC